MMRLCVINYFQELMRIKLKNCDIKLKLTPKRYHTYMDVMLNQILFHFVSRKQLKTNDTGASINIQEKVKTNNIVTIYMVTVLTNSFIVLMKTKSIPNTQTYATNNNIRMPIT